MPMEPTGTPVPGREFILETLPGHGSNCSAVLIKPSEINEFWNDIEPHLARCTRYSEGELEPEDFKTYLLDEQMQLWIAIDDEKIIASMVTQIIIYPQKRVLRIIAIAGGEMERWISFLPGLEELAMDQGCSAMEVWGRKGWLKVLEEYRCSYHILSKDLKVRKH